MLRSSIAGVFLACLALQAAASAVHPELLSFLRPQAADLQDAVLGNAGRALQQTFDEPNAPFTLDGFGIGTGGMFPGGGTFNGFALNVYNIIFRDVLNAGLNDAVARALPNTIGDLNNVIPPEISGFFGFGNDVVALYGYDWLDKYVGQYLAKPSAKLGEWKPAGCVGPTYSLTVNGGECEKRPDGSVECTKPSIKLESTPFECNLPYKTGASVKGKSYKFKQTFGSERSGTIGLPAGVYNFGAALNITAPNVGFSAQLNRIANDFGVQQWWQFLGQFAVNELLRIQTALLTGSVDGRLIDAGAVTTRSSSSSPIESGLLAVKDAGVKLLNKIATRMGLSERDLAAGLEAAGVPVPTTTTAGGGATLNPQQNENSPKQQQQQQRRAKPAADLISADEILSKVADVAAKGSEQSKVVTKQAEGNPDLLDKLQNSKQDAKKTAKP